MGGSLTMEHEPTRQERREKRRNNGRKMRVSGRSVLLLSELARAPKRNPARRLRRQPLDSHEMVVVDSPEPVRVNTLSKGA
jgi:hypothetical protein